MTGCEVVSGVHSSIEHSWHERLIYTSSPNSIDIILSVYFEFYFKKKNWKTEKSQNTKNLYFFLLVTILVVRL